TASMTACATGELQAGGKSNGWRPEGQPAVVGGAEAWRRRPPGTSLDRVGRDHRPVLEFRRGVARGQVAQAAVEGFTRDAVALELRRGVAGGQLAQTAVEGLAGNAVSQEFRRGVAQRQLAQTAVEGLAGDAVSQEFRCGVAQRQLA